MVLPPPFSFNEITGFETGSRLHLSPEIQCPLPPRRHRSVDLEVSNEKLYEDSFLIATFFLVSSSHDDETSVREHSSWFWEDLSQNEPRKLIHRPQLS